MSVRLEDTNAAAVSAAIASERRRMGGGATGLVLTLVIPCEEADASDALTAAATAAREHPCRILCVISRPGRSEHRLDAEVSVGGDDGPGETVTMRLRGHLAKQPANVVLPLLVSDTPIVTWWPGAAPAVPANDPLGQLAQRRITDSAAEPRPLKALLERQESYQPGDTDLAWTRCTPWRSLLAAVLDRPTDPITSAEVHAARTNPSGPLLAGWLRDRLDVPVTLNPSRGPRLVASARACNGSRPSRGPGVTGIRLDTRGGEISLTRNDGRTGWLLRPGEPRREVPLRRRDLADLLAEELRRLDADPVYGASLAETVLDLAL
jgi:glucose-6-phosphate dehydrogenase assembly protein OpcA